MSFSRSSLAELVTIVSDGIVGSLGLCKAFGRALIELPSLTEGALAVDLAAEEIVVVFAATEAVVATDVAVVTIIVGAVLIAIAGLL